jgi:uncharacterized DUF497 family protein
MFDWDAANIAHIARHGVTPEEAEEVLRNDPMDVGAHNVDGEERYGDLGVTNAMRTLFVVTTFRGERTRVVTAYDPPPALRRLYSTRKGQTR